MSASLAPPQIIVQTPRPKKSCASELESFSIQITAAQQQFYCKKGTPKSRNPSPSPSSQTNARSTRDSRK
ncbi:unnamed protein product [Cylicocyclus nassatus]|uniref:Uncharacterized protein n=1 Tax=Cylicocyclus nassatus TaxID=53992 RepID=A0AA36HAW4_CYLNA|nr:unnamed protein product [Cylicocyclus nassatus]